MKNIILATVAAAALVFSGCGSSSSDKKDPAPAGGDGNITKTFIPVKVVGVGPKNITMTFTQLQKDDKGQSSTTGGKRTQATARAACKNAGYRLPKVAEITFGAKSPSTNLLGLLVANGFTGAANAEFSKEGFPTVWLEEAGKALTFEKDANGAIKGDGYITDETGAAYFTCVK